MSDRNDRPQHCLGPSYYLKRGIAVYAAVIVLCTLLIQLGRYVGVLAPYTGTLVIGIFFYAPIWLLHHFGENLRQYALTSKPLGKNLLLCGVVAAVIFPPYVAAFFGYYTVVCRQTPMGFCSRFVGEFSRASWRWPRGFGEQVLGHLAVGLSEEIFFRGYLQSELDRAWPTRWRVLGANIGPALFVSSALFALGHLMVNIEPTRLAVFFPALIFGWMRAKSGSVAPGALFHACCNLLNLVLYTAFFS